MFIAFDLVTVALALLGFYTYPVIVAVANVALGRETMDRPRVVALVLAVLGMVAVVASQLDPRVGHQARCRRARAGPRRRRVPGAVRDHQPERLPAGAGVAGDERRAGDDRRLQHGPGPAIGAGEGADLPAARPLRPAAARCSRGCSRRPSRRSCS